MGFESEIAGYLAVKPLERSREAAMDETLTCIQSLPFLSEDYYPFLCREMFSVTQVGKNQNPVPLAYRSIIVHFGQSIKEQDDQLGNWLHKYEDFMKGVPCAWESLVYISLIPYSQSFPRKHLSYHWYRETLTQGDEAVWQFEGDPANWKDLMEIVDKR